MKFLIPPHKNIKHFKYQDHDNNPVNPNKVLTISSSKAAYYPDNEGIPTILFWFGGENKHQWFFDKGEEKLRDTILKNLTCYFKERLV